MSWKGHYTGIETWEKRFSKFNIYLNRDWKTKKLSFIRVGFFRKMLGVFIGNQNYGRGYVKGGFQLFTNELSLGFGHPAVLSSKNVEVTYSGSSVKPFTSCVIILFKRVVFAFNSPKWLIKKKEKELEKYWEDWAEHCDDETMTDPEANR